MHRSRIGLALIDHPEQTWDAGLASWAGVRGVEPVTENADMPEYLSLGRIGAVALESQRTGHGTVPRVHLDVETDDVDAEIARVVALGAVVFEQHDHRAVLTDPGGLLFCVVPVQLPDVFDQEAHPWP